MKRRMLSIGCVGLLVLGVLGAAPAAAQPVVMPPPTAPRIVSPDQVLATLRSNGYSPLERPTRRGVTYALRAVDPDGAKVRVIVDARAGRILAVTNLEGKPLGKGPGIVAPPRATTALPLGPGVAVASPPPIAPEPNATRSLNAPPNDIVTPRRPPPSPPLAGPRPPAVTPPPRVATRPADDEPPLPQIMAPEPRPGSVLPPPPERFPQRVAPMPELKRKPPAPRPAVLSVLPKSPPLPRPKPEITVGQRPPVVPAPVPSVAPPQAPPPAPPPAASSLPEELPN